MKMLNTDTNTTAGSPTLQGAGSPTLQGKRLPAGFDLNLAIRLLDKKIEQVRTTNKMAAIRAMFDHIIKMQREGASIEDVLECLNEAGLDVTEKTLNTYLARIKRERGLTRGKKKARSAVAKPTPVPGKHQDETPEPPGEFGQSLVRSAGAGSPASKDTSKDEKPPVAPTLETNTNPGKMRSKKEIVAHVEKNYEQYLPKLF